MKSSVALHSFAPLGPDEAGIVSWAHIGDLHMVAAGQQNQLDLAAIVDQINAAFAGAISFVYLPGDNADHGDRAAYAVVRKELDRLTTPWCAIVGDHDVHEHHFTNFLHAMAERTHYAFTVGRTRFIAMNAFDVPDPPSFTVSDDQISWVKRELQTATGLGQTKVLLLHCYPSDLKLNASELHEAIRNFDVRLVEMGHTHYNEVANDGHTLYAATRSTGQIEEGPVGFSITNLDGDAVSWRFFPLGTLPAVMITSPADERMLAATDGTTAPRSVRAKIWSSRAIQNVEAHIRHQGSNGDHQLTLNRLGESRVWEASLSAITLKDGLYILRVEATDDTGAIAADEIRVAVGKRETRKSLERDQDNFLEAWPEHGLLGTQLGPNKNGKKW